MKTTNQNTAILFTSLEQVSNALNEKYSKIKDFRTYANDNVIRGGFYEMSYNDRIAGNGNVTYYFYESFYKMEDEMKDFNKAFESLDKLIQKQLKKQKANDEGYAKENNLPVSYMFDYSLIEA